MSELQKSLILHDETGQPWAITVRPDGQLQTAKWPDGEPVAFAREFDAGKVGKLVRATFREQYPDLFINESDDVESSYKGGGVQQSSLH